MAASSTTTSRGPASPPRERRALTAGLRVGATVLGLYLCVVAVRAVPESTNAFVAHYAAARALLEGAGGEHLYDDAWFAGQVSRFEPGVRDVFWANPPSMGLLVLPVAWADYRVARGVWIFSSLLLFLGTAAWLVRRLPLDGPWAPGVLCVVLAAHPVRENLLHGQVYLVALALLTASWWGYRRGREPVLGAPLGALLATKGTGLVVWVLLLGQRRWRGLAWGAGAAGAVAAASLPLVGVGAWRRWTTEAAGLPSEPLLAVTAFQTVPGFFRHLLGGGDPRAGSPLVDLPVVADAAAWGVAALLLGTSLVAARRAGRSDALFAAFVLLGLVLSPVSSEAHYVLALLPVALLAAGLVERGVPAAPATLLAVGSVLLVVDAPFRSPALADGARALLAYPRLYGALLLWGLALAWSLDGRPRNGAGDPEGRSHDPSRIGGGAEGSPGAARPTGA